MNAPGRPPAAALPFWRRPLRLSAGGTRLSVQRRATLIRQLATLAAVMPISDAVATLARQPARPAETAILQRTNRALQAGNPLAAALPADAFPAEVRATIAAGEASGRLALLLNRLADTLEAQAALRSRLVSAFAYPILLILVATGVIVAMLIFVVPEIAAQLAGSDQPLPALTRAVLAVSSFLQRWWAAVAALLLAAAVGLWLAARRPAARARLDAAILALPGIGGWVAGLEAVRWSRLLATMLSAGLPLAEALGVVAPTLATAPWQAATRQMAADVRAGASLSATLVHLPSPPPLLVSLVQSGEASGRLAPLLESAATSLDRQLSDRSRTVMALVEPGIILLLGLIVGMIILAVLLPILQLNTLAGASIGASP